MGVVVETPKWSFVKYRFRGGCFLQDYVSPLPTLFNYGFFEGMVGGDGMALDALILGGKHQQGTKLDYVIVGKVQFYDGGVVDDKIIVSKSGKISVLDRLKIDLFFRFYVIFKTIRGERCNYKGIIVNNKQ